MNYELAKKLKDAGFPQDKRGGGVYDANTINNADNYAIPTLSELIEACGYIHTGMDSFKLELMPLGAGWRASAQKAVVENERDSKDTIGLWCSTPEEAVANLWLKLNEK